MKGVGIKSKFSELSIRERLRQYGESVKEACVEEMKDICVEVVDFAHSIPSDIGYENISGNMRSSIGGKVFCDGVERFSYYKLFNEGTEGMQRGMQMADEVGSSSAGVVLAISAGMDYAVSLEAKGRDVISSAHTQCVSRVEELKQKIIERMKGVSV